ncbi:MAG: glycosyltransferase family 9 protein [Bacteroidales bacterium]|nr:glycosyltransferase family 9 protein [Bacteroidales bacterium]
MTRILLSRTDRIGDVVLTLPLAGVLKKYLPQTTLLFLGKTYTRPVIEACSFVDEFIDWDLLAELPYREQVAAFRAFRADAVIHVFMNRTIAKLADAADIPVKVGSAHRLFSWLYCNQVVWFSRRHSDLHEAQLNLKLLKPLGIEVMLERERIPEYYGLQADARYEIRDTRYAMRDPASDIRNPESGIRDQESRFRLILHPKSKGSAREWGLENFSRLIELLPQNKFSIYITGTKAEGELMKEFLEKHREQVTDRTGKMDLSELMEFINSCDGMVAASTGPLHLAAASGKVAIGLYAPMRPIHPARWAPLGKNASYLVLDKPCNDCRKNLDCHCMKEIRAEEVVAMLMND